MSADAHNHNQESSAPDIDPEQISALRDEMFRFARLQLRDDHLAEDAVHEAIAAALMVKLGVAQADLIEGAYIDLLELARGA